ncbi:MAG: ferrous iron transporter B, partial [Clostridia bacterium]|nr:ferrous iron transporter B [Clostridia bacterium]
ITNFINVDELVLEGGASEVATTIGLTASAALAYLMFNLYTPPCFAALGAMSAEMKSAKWFWGGIALQLGTGFTVGFIVYQLGTLITTGSVGRGFLGGIIAVLVFVAVVGAFITKANKRIEVRYSLKAKEKVLK